MLRLTIKILEKRFDIMVKKDQRIIEVLKILHKPFKFNSIIKWKKLLEF